MRPARAWPSCIRSRAARAIAAAYFDHGVRTFALDTHEELAKILDATGGAKDLNLIVRLAVSSRRRGLSASPASSASTAHEAPALLLPRAAPPRT